MTDGQQVPELDLHAEQLDGGRVSPPDDLRGWWDSRMDHISEGASPADWHSAFAGSYSIYERPDPPGPETGWNRPLSSQLEDHARNFRREQSVLLEGGVSPARIRTSGDWEYAIPGLADGSEGDGSVDQGHFTDGFGNVGTQLPYDGAIWHSATNLPGHTDSPPELGNGGHYLLVEILRKWEDTTRLTRGRTWELRGSTWHEITAGEVLDGQISWTEERDL